MTTYQNPFRYRASEQQRDLRSFLLGFGPGALNMLPESVWDRLVILRSAPGAGKTSLMRVFTAENVRAMLDDRDNFRELVEAVERVGGSSAGTPQVLGAYLNLERDYRSLTDVGMTEAMDHRLFFRLLDARIAVAFLRSALIIKGYTFPDDLSRVKLVSRDSTAASEQARKRLGGDSGPEIYKECRRVEQEMLSMLDSLLPVDWEQQGVGHNELYSLRFFSEADITIDGHVLAMRPLILLDDGHRLHPDQRRVLLERLGDRTLNVGRWYSERYEALSRQGVLDQVGKEGRDLELIELETVAKGGTSGDGRVRFAAGQFEKMLLDIANRRAFRALRRALEQEQDFSELIDFEDDELLGTLGDQAIQEMRSRVVKLFGSDRRYDSWIKAADKLKGFDAALRWRELDILIRRDKDRAQGDLFEEALSESEAKARSNSGMREAAALALAKDLKLPYYAGLDHLPKLGSRNVEQFLALCGDLFAEIQAEITLQRKLKPKLSADRQDKICRRASDRFWREIPRRVPDGHLVQRFVLSVVKMAEPENAKPTIPYPPGVTGTALLMIDRERLLDPKKREKIPGAEELLTALSNSISYNIVSAELDRSVKNKQVMVIYINRLLCPHFGLPLGRGGYREKKLEAMSKWMTEPVEGPLLNDRSEQLSF